MGNTIKLRVDESLQNVLERIRKDVANDMKKRYKIDEITVHGTMASKILAAKMSGKKSIKFGIDKVSRNKGILRLL